MPTNGSWTVFLNNNKLRQIPGNAFMGIKLHMLVLDNNEIETIDDQAFDGSEKSIIFLDMVGNKLTSLPTAIGKLQNIMSLSVFGNPLPDLDQEVMKNVSKSLLFIDFGSRELQAWPTSLKCLTKLASIDISGVSFNSLPEDALSPYKDSLQHLGIHDTNLTRLPSSMNELHNLQDLKLDGNTNLTAEAIHKSMPEGLPGLIEVTFQNNGLAKLPDILLNASHLYSVTVFDEPVVSFDENLFTSNFSDNFLTLIINNTKLSHVPKCVSKVNSITQLQITSSNISSIHEDDFYGMKNLNILDLSENPLWNISDSAFMKNNALRYVKLAGTRLEVIPRGIQNLKSPQYLDLSGCPIQCSCNNLGWIKNWKSRPGYFQIAGECNDLKMNLMAYINNEIPKCIGHD
nr:plant intracellular Ras-group-related LRR protein 4 isoform X2 [Crassostrea gigas]